MSGSVRPGPEADLPQREVAANRPTASRLTTAAPDAAGLVHRAYEEHRAALYGFLFSATRDRELAAELLQEAYTRLLKAARAGDSPVEPRAWLFRVAGNLAISVARRRQLFHRFAPRLVRDETVVSVEAGYLQRERSDRVRDELAELGRVDRVALLMAAAGCSAAEIGQALGKSEVATRSVLFRARLRLRDRIEATEAGASEVDR